MLGEGNVKSRRAEEGVSGHSRMETLDKFIRSCAAHSVFQLIVTKQRGRARGLHSEGKA